jgi:hypothetical protein
LPGKSRGRLPEKEKGSRLLQYRKGAAFSESSEFRMFFLEQAGTFCMKPSILQGLKGFCKNSGIIKYKY